MVVLAACSDLPTVPRGVCGNHVLEAGESCDRSGPGCGAPGSPGACRFTCESGACPAGGFVCGLDTICRKPRGTYAVSVPVGNAGDRFDLVDYDLDGNLDVADRGFDSLSLLHNDGAGELTPYASGVVAADPTVAHAVAAGRFAADDSDPLLVALDSYGVGPFHVGADERITPLAVAQVERAKGVDFLGAVSFDSSSGQLPLIVDRNTRTLTAVDLYDSARDVTLALDSACGASSLDSLRATILPSNDGTFVIGLVAGPITGATSACVIRTVPGMTRQLVATRLDLTALTNRDPGYTIDFPMLADFNNDNQIDMAVIWGGPLDTNNNSVAMWPAAPTGFGTPLFYDCVDGDTCDFIGPFFAGDFDGDGFADVADSWTLLFNGRAPAGKLAFTVPQYIDVNLQSVGDAHGWIDINGDSTRDFLFTGDGEDEVVACVGNPVRGNFGPAYSCASSPTGLGSVDGLTTAKLGVDGLNDIVAWTTGSRSAGPVPEGELAILYGRPHEFPSAEPLALATYRSTVGGAAGVPTPASSTLPGLTDSLLVALDGDATGFALGRAVPGGSVAFDIPASGFDVRIVEGKLLIIQCPYTNGFYPTCDLNFYEGGGSGAFTNVHDVPLSQAFGHDGGAFASGVRFSDLPAVAGDTLPAITWVESDGLYTGRLGDLATVKTIDIQRAAAPSDTTLLTWIDQQALDLDGSDDPAGDGRKEMLITAEDSDNHGCHLYVGRVPAGQGVPGPLVEAAAVKDCRLAQYPDAYYTDFRLGAPFPVEHAGGASGVGRDLVVLVVGDDARGHFARLPALGHDQFGPAQIDPAIFHFATPVPIAPDDLRLVDAADMNGDNIPDLVFRTPQGVVVALAEVDFQ